MAAPSTQYFLGTKRFDIRGAAICDGPVDAHRANQLGGFPPRAVYGSAIRLARLAGQYRLGELQQFASTGVFCDRFCCCSPSNHLWVADVERLARLASSESA